MSGFVAAGCRPLAEVRDAMGTEALGAALAAGLISALQQDPWGGLHQISEADWRGPHARQMMRDGRMPDRRGIGNTVLIVVNEAYREVVAALAARPAPKAPDLGDWCPSEGVTAKAWASLPAVEAEARRRAKAALSSNPSQGDVARAMARMWEEGGRPRGSWRTFEQYLVAAKD